MMVDSAEDGACAANAADTDCGDLRKSAVVRPCYLSLADGPADYRILCTRSVLRHAMRQPWSSAPVGYRAALPQPRSEAP